MDKAAPPSPTRSGGAVLRGLMDFRPSAGLERTADADDAVALGLAFANVYTFASADYPGAAESAVWDSNGTTAVGVFIFNPSTPAGGGADAQPTGSGSVDSGDATVGSEDAEPQGSGTVNPGSGPTPPTAFTFTGGVYQILTVPNSTESIATGINAAGLIVGVSLDLSGVRFRRRGFVNDAGTFSKIDFPGADETQAFGVNDAGTIVGSYRDTNGEHGFVHSGGTFTPIDFPGAPRTVATGINTAGDIVGRWSAGAPGDTRGFLLQAGVGFTPIDFPLATETRPVGINDAGEIAGSYTDAAFNTHGFIKAGGQFSKVDVVGAVATELTRIKNGGLVTGSYTDALGEVHGLIGQ